MTARRQQALFAAEDWKIAYQAFTEIDFQAYDFDSIRVALVEYVRTNFPENFNDYVESSEFIAIIEMLAYLAQSLSFRVDVNTRENFLETAERRDSVFKLAQMLGYNPKRNVAASGLMKLTAVKTTEQITDSLGNNLQNRTVFWNDINNAQSYEQFISILNSAMSKTNRFTTPVKEGRVGNIPTELYQLNTPLGSPITYNVNIRVDGSSKQFNVVNPDFVDGGSFSERHPDPANLFHMIYRNDGRGLDSPDTGFYVFLKQGTLDFVDFNYTTPVENRRQDVAVANINETDVYLQEINEDGLVLNKWEKIPNTVGQTLNFNSKALDTRNLYAVENLGTEGVRLRFTDGNFGRVPVGVFRFWHRVSEPRRFSVPPEAARGLNITIPYQDINGRAQQLTVTFSLQRAISNSLPPESLAAIKQRAPQVYYTQNRMVSAQDYNVFPESQSQNITKLKAINRTHAGHSRYIELNDPTGTFYNVDTFADDAYLYRELANKTRNVVIDNNTTALDVTTSVLSALLKELSLNNFAYQTMRDAWQQAEPNIFRFTPEDNVIWNPQPARSTGREGFLTEEFSTKGLVSVLINQLPRTQKLQENTFLKFVNPQDPADYVWVRVTAVRNNGRLTAGVVTAQGPWTLSADVPAGWRLEDTIVALRRQFTLTEREAIEEQIKNRVPVFGIGYNLDTDSWYVIDQTLLPEAVRKGAFAITEGDGAGAPNQGGSTWLFLMEFQPIDQNSFKYALTVRGEDYVIQSRNDLKFYNVKDIKVLDATGRSSQDLITITTTNTQPGGSDAFEWIGEAWRNVELGTVHTPRAVRVDLPLKTRDTTFRDVAASWISNFGIFRFTNDLEGTVNRNEYVGKATVDLNVFHPVAAFSTESNVVIANNIGRVETLPSSIRVEFDTDTFDGDTVVNNYRDRRGILYRQRTPVGEEVFFAPAGEEPVSLGPDPDPEVDLGQIQPDPNNPGRIFLIEDNGDGTGVFEYRDLGSRLLLNSEDSSRVINRDVFEIRYIRNKKQLDLPIVWTISDVYREADGFVDPQRVKVAAIDSDGDGVPDRPRQFAEFVDSDDLVLFENFRDFDGSTYARPVEGRILDLRTQEDIRVLPNQVGPAAYNDFVELSTLKWLLVRKLDSARKMENNINARGLIVYVQETGLVYEVTPSSTNQSGDIKLEPTQDWFVRQGRGQTQNITDPDPQPGIIRWQHVAPNDVRVDPSISNIVEMLVLTTSYNDQVRRWLARPVGEFPLEPTSDQLSTEFAALNEFKNASDVLAFRSARFRLLFGEQADEKYQARFRVVKLSDQISDNELKTRIIATINDYFDVANWDFGEAFYFTELSTFIHQRLGSSIGSIVILPKSRTGRLGELFQVQAEPNELFASTATVRDIEIVSRLDNQTLRIDR